MDIPAELKKALQLHQAGKYFEAAEIYRAILGEQPNNPDALNLLGLIFQTAGNLDLAIKLLEEATVVQPDFFVPFVNLGNVLQEAGQLEEAVQAFQKAVDLNPEHPETANNLASALNELGRHEDAATACKIALAAKGSFAEAHNNLGNALAALNRPKEAVESYQKALAFKPAFGDAHFNLGKTLLKMGDKEAAAESLRLAVSLDGENALKHFNLGNGLMALDRYEEAGAAFREAIRLEPDNADALGNLGASLQSLGQLDDSVAAFRQAIDRQPDSADLHWNLSLALLQRGDYEEGWREFEWRWDNPAFTSPSRQFPQPQWSGEDIKGKTILLHAEQGLGDTLQFIRYAPLVAARGAKVILECRPPLTRLSAETDGVDQVISLGEDLPDFDCHIPLMSLPLVFETTVDTIPADVPYLTAPPAAITDAEGLKIGIVWGGSPTHINDHNRSCDVSLFAPLFDIPGTTFFSLQADARATDLHALDLPSNVIDLTGDLQDFADTATAVAALDLVISVDTAVLHLAGALAKPAWGLIPFAPSYLWMNDRDDSPWYPTVRLFRQTLVHDWDSVFEQVASDLKNWG